MGVSPGRMAASLGWAGSLSLHAAVWLSAVGVIPLTEGLQALADTLTRDEPASPPEPESTASDPAPPPPPPKPPDAQRPEPKPVEVRVPEPEPPEPEPEESPEVTLGIDESTATDTDTWLGFAEATPEHGGAALGYEQALLSRAPGERSATLDLEPGLGASDAPPGMSAKGESATIGDRGEDDATRAVEDAREAFVAADALPTITLAPAARPEPRTSAPGVGATVAGPIAERAAGAVETARETLEALRLRGGEGASAAAGQGGRPIDETAQPAADAQPLEESGAGGEELVLGFVSDRDSDAAALAQAVAVNPGKPLAAKGLRIQTVRPKWSTYALATASPNDVVVRIWFDGSGRVTEAKIIQSSGRNDVDRPILDAVYNWRATGEQLRKVKLSPDGRVQLVFRIDLER